MQAQEIHGREAAREALDAAPWTAVTMLCDVPAESGRPRSMPAFAMVVPSSAAAAALDRLEATLPGGGWGRKFYPEGSGGLLSLVFEDGGELESLGASGEGSAIANVSESAGFWSLARGASPALHVGMMVGYYGHGFDGEPGEPTARSRLRGMFEELASELAGRLGLDEIPVVEAFEAIAPHLNRYDRSVPEAMLERIGAMAAAAEARAIGSAIEAAPAREAKSPGARL